MKACITEVNEGTTLRILKTKSEMSFTLCRLKLIKESKDSDCLISFN